MLAWRLARAGAAWPRGGVGGPGRVGDRRLRAGAGGPRIRLARRASHSRHGRGI